MTYNHIKNKVYALLKDKAKSDDILKAAFHLSQVKGLVFLLFFCTLGIINPNWGNLHLQGHVLLHSIRSSLKKQAISRKHHDHLSPITVPIDI